MPTRVRGVVLSADGKTPQSGVVVEAFDPATAFAQGEDTTDTNGEFTLTGLQDRTWIVRRKSGSGNIQIQPVTETIISEDHHGQRSVPSAHAYSELRNIPSRFNVGVQNAGVLQGERTQINFTGSAINSITDDPTNDRVTVDIVDTGGGGGEANTASNAGVGGVGITLAKSGVDLPFKSIKADVISGIQISDDATNKNVRIAVEMAGMAFDTTPDGSADTVITFDSSAGTNKRVLLNDLPGGGGDTHPIADSTAIVKDPTDATKLLRVDVGGNTTGVTGVLAAAFSTAKTVTLPDATDTLVGRATTDTLANKTLTTPTIGDFSNAGHNHQNAAGGAKLDHGLALNGLTDDDHTQYALLAGRSGGQTLVGGTASGDDLTLSSTSHATKGNIFIDDNVGLNTTSPTAVNANSQLTTLKENGSGGFTAIVHSGVILESPQLFFGRARGTEASPTSVATGDEIGIISANTYNGTSWGRSGYLRFAADSSGGAGFTIATGAFDSPTVRLDITPVGGWTIDGTTVVFNTAVTMNGFVQNNSGASFSGGITGDVAFDTDTLFVDSLNGRVGFRTTAPEKAIHILEDGVGPSDRGLLSEIYFDGAKSINFNFRKARGTKASPLTCNNNDSVGLSFYAMHNGTSMKSMGKLGFIVDATPTSTTWPMAFILHTGTTTLTERFRVSSAGDMLYGTTTTPTGTTGKCIIFGDNGGDPTPGTNTAGLFAKDVAGTVEMFAVDEAANVTQLSPHDPKTGRWVFDSRNLTTGKRTRVDMQRLVELVEKLSGEKLFEDAA